VRHCVRGKGTHSTFPFNSALRRHRQGRNTAARSVVGIALVMTRRLCIRCVVASGGRVGARHRPLRQKEKTGVATHIAKGNARLG
jgi:hypothetical protein